METQYAPHHFPENPDRYDGIHPVHLLADPSHRGGPGHCEQCGAPVQYLPLNTGLCRTCGESCRNHYGRAWVGVEIKELGRQQETAARYLGIKTVHVRLAAIDRMNADGIPAEAQERAIRAYEPAGSSVTAVYKEILRQDFRSLCDCPNCADGR